MHYVWHRSENKHSTSLPPLLLSLTPGDIVYLVYMLARLPWLGETVCCLLLPLAKITDSEASNVGMVRSHFFSLLYFTPSNCQSAVNLRYKNTMREREKVKKRKEMPFSICTVRLRLKEGVSFLLSATLSGGTGCCFLSVDHTIPHVSDKR